MAPTPFNTVHDYSNESLNIDDEVLYRSSQTVVVRRQLGEGRSQVVKWAFGAGAVARLQRENTCLVLLEGIDGVMQLGESPQEQDSLYLEDNHGIELSEWLARSEITLGRKIQVALRLARIVARVHHNGVLHRDINPRNILVGDPDDRVVLIDFDLGCLASEAVSQGTASRELVGTLAYLAPEQSGRTGSTLDQRSDLYAVGATFYEIFCARPPFVETDALRLIHSHLAQVPTPPHTIDSQLPVALSRIVMRLLEKEPESRYQSADGLASDLQRLADAPNSTRAEDFILGNHDFGLRINPPAKPVGRSADLARTFEVFQGAMAGEGSVLLISGVPGVGKTAVVEGLRAEVEARNGYYVRGKFDQFRRDMDTDAVLSAFISLGRQLLAEPEAELQALRQQLREALGPNMHLMVDLNPEFATLFQIESRQASHMDPLVEGRRLIQGSLDMLRTICAAGRPVVMVLDELQWGTSAPISFLDNLVTAEPIAGLLLIGTYRDNEDEPTDHLAIHQAQWHRNKVAPQQIHLENLQDEDLALFLSQMLNLPTDTATELAEVLAPYTLGNPFDTVEFINILYTQKLLVHDEGWHWDIETIREAARNSEVRGLVEASLKRLPSGTVRLLRLMAYLGGEVERDLLLLASAESESGLELRLQPALDAGLVLQGSGRECSLRFLHARVQQASLGERKTDTKRRLHLLLARRLSLSDSYSTLAAEHYLIASSLINTVEEKVHAATLFHQAASNLLLINPVLVERLLDGGITLLDDRIGERQLDCDLKFELMCTQHTVLYSMGRLDDADSVYQRIVEIRVATLKIVDVSCVQISSLTNRGRAVEAVELGLSLMKTLGVIVPDQQALTEMVQITLKGFDVWIDHPQRKTDFDRAEITDPALIAVSRVIMRLMTPAFFSAPDLMAWLCIESRRIWSEHGPCGALVGPLAHCAPALIGPDNAYVIGHRVIEHVLEVAKIREFDVDVARAHYLYALSSGHWFDSLTSNADLARRTHESLVQRGDYQNACFCHIAMLSSAMDSSPSLDEHADEIAASSAFALRTCNDFAAAIFTQHDCWAEVLRGKQPVLQGSELEEYVRLEACRIEGFPIAVIYLYLLQAHLALMFNLPEQLARYSAVAMNFLPHIASSHTSVLGYLLRACALAREGAAQAHEDDPQFREFALCRQWICNRAADAPDNFEHLLHLVDAEAAWKGEDYQAAALAFDKARQMASTQPRAWQQAFIAERSAQFQHAYGVTGLSRDLLAEAHERYLLWGARQKVLQLEESHPWLGDKESASARTLLKPELLSAQTISTRSGNNIGTSVDAIDLLGILKASQALSSETSLDPLKTRITEILEALSGATSVSIILWHEDEQAWRLLPRAGSEGEKSLSVEEAGERNLLPLSAFRYFERTREMLVVDDAICDDRFSRDPYMRGLQHCSLMVMPLFSNGTVRAVLMLENNLSSSAFVADRLEAVNLVAGQLTVSLDNALLYASLERKVTERTEALAEANDRLESLSITDSLTGIANRRRFDQVLETECLRAQAKGSSIGLALIDIDEFKRYNDNYGHLYGDDALREVANALSGAARSDEDLVARYGGEEFVVVLPDTDMRGIARVAERMRAAVEKLQVLHEYSGHGFLSISAGVTAFVPSVGLNIEAEIDLADKALYLAKSRGRNRIVASDDDSDSDNQPVRKAS
ncbi:diguanylate cyclase domain-containing protein [Granulosicoccus antarcticus]|uniref:Phytochrome-like protein cph2 n=1 Tax=Granulosicoccus antarcticus IMCC3135 TaxID=1192854 RepID=A0A2Z2NWN9_9GAMM|nr:diguanylate cyclase [Granulosicoccus antarcticus]ASJ71574.1 Phytochrome-like protein cph2 [Granulosicoccus antarcticus IMCC3135]